MDGCARSLGAARYPGHDCGVIDGCCSVRGRVIVTGGYHREEVPAALSFETGGNGAARRGTADAGRPPSERVSGTYRFTPGSPLVAGGAATLERVRAPAGGAVTGVEGLREKARRVPSSGWFGVIEDATPGTVTG